MSWLMCVTGRMRLTGRLIRMLVGSRVVVSAKAVSQRSKGQASSPHVGADRAQSVNSGKSKQLQAYDAEYAGKQLAAQGRGGQS